MFGGTGSPSATAQTIIVKFVSGALFTPYCCNQSLQLVPVAPLPLLYKVDQPVLSGNSVAVPERVPAKRNTFDLLSYAVCNSEPPS